MNSDRVVGIEPASTIPTATGAGWRDLLWGTNLFRSLALSGGVALHAVNLYISTTILPSVVADIGGLDYYAWNTSIFVVASIIAAALSSRLLGGLGAKRAYTIAALVFAVGAVICATSPTMPAMLAGRAVQGFGGGMLVALPYAMIRSVFAESLWPRAMALISSMWGIATLLGPAIGGIFAEFGVWRAAFWSLIPVTAIFTLMALLILPGNEADPGDRPRLSPSEPVARVPIPQLTLLTAAVLAASVGSVGDSLTLNIGSVALAIALILGLVWAEARSPERLLPRGAFDLSSPLSILYAISALLAVTVTCTEIFVPLFLQVLHQRSPLQAGYIAALMSAGWTLAAVLGSGLRAGGLTRAFRASPIISLLSLGSLALIMPAPSGGGWSELITISLALVIVGIGVGLAYPHIAARVLHDAPDDEQDLAASSIMTVQLCATAFGAALAGLIVNLAGLGGLDGAGALGGVAGEVAVARAARALFVVLLLAPVITLRLIWRRAPVYAGGEG